MFTFKCLECGHVFEDGEQVSWTEPHGERLSGCPVCQGTYEEIDPCPICGSYNHDVNKKFCNVCRQATKTKMELFLNTLTKEERELLNIIYDGEWL